MRTSNEEGEDSMIAINRVDPENGHSKDAWTDEDGILRNTDEWRYRIESTRWQIS